MQGQKLKLLVNRFIVDAGNVFPCQSAAFSGGQILHRMEGEGGEVSKTTGGVSVLLRAKRMGSICHDRDPSQCFLDLGSWAEQLPFLINDLVQPVIIAGDTGQIHRDDHFRSFSNSCLNQIVIHLQGIALAVYHYDLRPNMIYDRSGGSIGVGRYDHFITGADTQNMQRHFRTGSLGIQAHRTFCTAVRSHPAFQFFCARTGGDPPGTKSRGNFFDLPLSNIRGRKRNIHHIVDSSTLPFSKFGHTKPHVIIRHY